MKLGKLAMVAAFGAVAFVSSAQAAGYFGAPNKRTVEGWACNPSLPNYQGWLHFYRDDGKVLGAAQANIQREEAVGAACGDGGAHGFQGTLDYPSEYLDNKRHTVRAYFLNPDGSSFELQNSVEILFDGGPQPYVFTYQTTPACVNPNPYFSIPGWLLYSSPQSFEACGTAYINPLTFVYIGDPAIPVGTETEFCADNVSVTKLPSNWQVIGNGTNGVCLKHADWSQLPPNPPVFGNFTYYQRLKIRKVQ